MVISPRNTTPPDKKLFAYLEGKYGVKCVEYLGPIGRNGEDVYSCIKPDRSGAIYYTDGDSGKRSMAGRQMATGPKETIIIDIREYENGPIRETHRYTDRKRANDFITMVKSKTALFVSEQPRVFIPDLSQAVIRDQGERNMSAAMAGASMMDLMRNKEVGRTMTNRKEKDALVIGDDSAVDENYGHAQSVEADSGPFPEDYDDYWESVYEAAGSLVRERDDKAYKLHRNLGDWYCEVSNFGWRGQGGRQIFSVDTYERSDRQIGSDFLRHILPNTDCTFYIYDEFDGFGLKIDNAHHDAPTGGEMYYCAPIDWMIAKGYWGGLNSDGEEMIWEIREALLEEWETEFLNKELSAATTRTGDRWWQGSGQRVALDIEFPTLYKKFIAGYGNPTGDYLPEFKEELRDFFEKYYAVDANEEFADYLHGSDMDSFGKELTRFIKDGGYQVDDRTIPDDRYKRLQGMYDSILEYKQTGRNK